MYVHVRQNIDVWNQAMAFANKGSEYIDLWQSNIAIENGHLYQVFPWEMVIVHVFFLSLPEGIHFEELGTMLHFPAFVELAPQPMLECASKKGCC